MRIRQANPADVSALDKLLQETARGLSPAVFCRDDRAFLAAHINEQGFILLAEEAQLAGMVMVRFPGLAADHLGRDVGWQTERLIGACHLESLAVHPHYRGQGLQRRLLAAAEAHLAEDYTEILATVAPENAASLRNFICMGYTVIAQVEKYGGYTRYILYKRR